MNAKHTKLALQWLSKADHDLITASQTLLLPDGPTDTVCFHAQQAIEKALKAVLTFHQVTFPKIHDLVRLMDIAGNLIPGMTEYAEIFAEISAYSVKVRYPDDWFEPSREDAKRAFDVAESIVARIRQYLK